MYQKVTITLPSEVIEALDNEVGKGKKSGFIADAINEKIENSRIEKVKTKLDAWGKFSSHRKDLPKLTTDEILSLIKKGRK